MTTEAPSPILRTPKPWGVDFLAAVIESTIAGSAVPVAERGFVWSAAPFVAGLCGAAREAFIKGDMQKENWKNALVPVGAGMLGAAFLAFGKQLKR